MSRAEGNFNPRPSCEGRRNLNPFWRLTAEFQSTSLLRGTTAERGRHYDRYHISIHVPLARDDQRNLRRHVIHNAISIHVPLARDDSGYGGRRSCSGYFNPRPSCEGRPGLWLKTEKPCYFNPRPSCEGRPLRARSACFILHFNPRPSCEGRL